MGRDRREGDAYRQQTARSPLFEFRATDRARSFGGRVSHDVCVSAKGATWGMSLSPLGSGNETPLPFFTW